MTNVKSKRKKLVKILVVIIILIVCFISEKTDNKTNDNVKMPEIVQDLNENQDTNTTAGEKGKLKVYMIDVGQADSFLFVQDQYTALVDCGSEETAKDVVTFLNNMGITKLDYVFCTNPKDEYMSGMYEIISNFAVDRVILPNINSGDLATGWYVKLKEKLFYGVYPIDYSQIGNEYILGDAIMKVLWQNEGFEENMEDYSTVIKISYGDMDILMTGDAGEKIENKLIESGTNISAEILKLGQHGSDTATSAKFLDAVSPKYALISTDHSPNASVLFKLKEKRIECYRTDEKGTVTVTMTKRNIKIETEFDSYFGNNQNIK